MQNISANPLASALLVQVTRSTLNLPISQALMGESLAYSTLQGGKEFERWLAQYQLKRGNKSRQNITKPAVLVERQQETLNLVLNTPENRNALSVETWDALTESFKLVIMDDSIESVHVSANGPNFSAGGDLSEFGSNRDQALAHQIRLMRMPAQYLAQRSEHYTFHLHGACFGAGVEMPAFAGKLVASPEATFHLPEVAMSLIPGAGGCVSIPRRIGQQKANFLAITRHHLSATEALQWGLIDEIVDSR